jgi:hypothetical protein
MIAWLKVPTLVPRGYLVFVSVLLALRVAELAPVILAGPYWRPFVFLVFATLAFFPLRRIVR